VFGTTGGITLMTHATASSSRSPSRARDRDTYVEDEPRRVFFKESSQVFSKYLASLYKSPNALSILERKEF
jgi:hypothetical protein